MIYIADVDRDYTGPFPFQTKLRSPFDVLAAMFGAPHDDFGDRVSTAWTLTTASDPSLHITVRDSRDEKDRSFDVAAFRAKPWFDWDVECSDEKSGTAFCNWLSQQVTQRVAGMQGGRKLTPAATKKLNELIAQGVALNEALARVAEWSSATDARQSFAWPIVNNGA